MEKEKEQRVAERVNKLTADLANAGKIIEGGWLAMRLVVIPIDASPIQIHEMRKAYFCGAQHLLASIISITDPKSDEPDMQAMFSIEKELRDFCDELEQERKRNEKTDIQSGFLAVTRRLSRDRKRRGSSP